MIEIGYERRDRIAYVTLNRPEAKNAVTQEMHEELCRIWSDFDDDDSADVAILTGTGDAFCTGDDLATYVPLNYVDATPSRVRAIVDIGFRRRHPAGQHVWRWRCHADDPDCRADRRAAGAAMQHGDESRSTRTAPARCRAIGATDSAQLSAGGPFGAGTKPNAM